MVRITTSINGKKYELVPDGCVCLGCGLKVNKGRVIVGEKKSYWAFLTNTLCVVN
jgi:hypothetical protein